MMKDAMEAKLDRTEPQKARIGNWLRDFLAIAGVLALGYSLGSARTVKAATTTSGDLAFELAGLNQTSSLLVYQPSTKTIYVYQGATTGNSSLQCSFKFVMGTPGGVVQRVSCPVQTLVP